MNRASMIVALLAFQFTAACRSRQPSEVLQNESVVTERSNERSDFGGLAQTIVMVPSCANYRSVSGEASAKVGGEGEFASATFYYSREWAERLVRVGYSPEVAAWRARSCDVRKRPPTWRVIHQAMSLRQAEVGCALMGMELVSPEGLRLEFHDLEAKLFPNVKDDVAARSTSLTYLEWLQQTAGEIESNADGFWLKPEKRRIDSGRLPPIITLKYALEEQRLQSLEAAHRAAFYQGDAASMRSLSPSIEAAKKTIEKMRLESTIDTHDVSITTVDRFDNGNVLQINTRSFQADVSRLTQAELVQQLKNDGVKAALWPDYPAIKGQGRDYKGLAVCEQRTAPVAVAGDSVAREFADTISK
jgi:hypothetical protein